MLYLLIIYSQVPLLYAKILTNKLNLKYSKKSKKIKEKLDKNITSQSTFSFTLTLKQA